MIIQNSSRLEGKHLKNSRSAQRITPTHNLYTESSYISQILAHQQKISDIPNSNKRLLSNLSPISINYKEGKILQKNYLQNKYSLILEGNQAQRAGWKKYLLDGFKEKIENIFNIKRTPKLFKIKRQYFTKSVAMQPTIIQNDYLTVDALIKKNNPEFDIEAVQDSLIQEHKQYLLKSKNTDYDEKLQSLVKQFEIIVDRIEKEAFKVKIPANFSTAMQNYNDFYNVALDSKNKNNLLNKIDFSKFELKHRVKQSYALNFWDREEADENLEQQIQTCRVSTQRECQEEILAEIQQYQSAIEIQAPEEIPAEVNQEIEEQQLVQIEEIPQIQEENNLVQIKEKTKRIKNLRYKNKKKKSQESLQTIEIQKEEEIKLEQNQVQEQVKGNTFRYDHRFVDYMLSLEDVYEADLNQFREKKQVEYDSFIFCDPDEEVIYKHQADWNVQLDNLLEAI